MTDLITRIDRAIFARQGVDPDVVKLLRDLRDEVVALREELAQEQMESADLDAHTRRAM